MKVTEYRTEYMRDGAEVTLSSSYPDNPLMTIHNRFFFAFENLMYPMVRTVHGPNKRAISRETVANDCVAPGARDVKVIGHEKILGYMAAALRLPNGVGNDGRYTEWRAPALGCFVLRSTSGNGGARRVLPAEADEKRATKESQSITHNRRDGTFSSARRGAGLQAVRAVVGRAICQALARDGASMRLYYNSNIEGGGSKRRRQIAVVVPE